MSCHLPASCLSPSWICVGTCACTSRLPLPPLALSPCLPSSLPSPPLSLSRSLHEQLAQPTRHKRLTRRAELVLRREPTSPNSELERLNGHGPLLPTRTSETETRALPGFQGDFGSDSNRNATEPELRGTSSSYTRLAWRWEL